MSEEKTRSPDVEEPYFNLWLDERLKRIEDRIDSAEKRLESRMDSLEKRLESRMDSLEKRLESRMDSLEKRLESRIASVERIQYWTLGIFSALFIAILVKLFIP